MTLYIGVDFHPHQQTVSFCNTHEGEIQKVTLFHNPQLVRSFYEKIPPAVVGIEASSSALWFEQMLTELGHQLLVGNPTLIRARARSRHKSDNRDAELLLDLLVKDEFPSIWRRPVEGQSVLEQLRFRHCLVKHRTQVCNRLQALAHSAGLPKRGIQTKRARVALLKANFTETQSFERDQLFELLDDLSSRIKLIEARLEEKAAADAKVQLLLTHKGIGVLSALAVVHTLGDVSRFPSGKQVVAYTGLDPVERSSAGRVRMGAISKAGSSVLRHLLGQAMHVVIRYDGELKAFYQRLATKRTKAIAKTAATRKLLVRLFIMLKDEINYAEYKRRGSAVGIPALSRGLK